MEPNSNRNIKSVKPIVFDIVILVNEPKIPKNKVFYKTISMQGRIKNHIIWQYLCCLETVIQLQKIE